MTKEVFKPIKGYEGIYEISNLGRVKALPVKGRLSERINTGFNDRGYRRIGLVKDKKEKQFRIHQLVAQAFLGHTIDGYSMVVDHIDNDKSNNRVENLQVITQRENILKDKPFGASKYRGVNWNKRAKKWHAQIGVNGKNKHLGLFTSEEEAHQAYQKALKEIQCV